MGKYITKGVYLKDWIYYTGFKFDGEKKGDHFSKLKENAIEETKKFITLHNIQIEEI